MIGRPPREADFVPGFRFITFDWGHPLFSMLGSSSKRCALLCEVTEVSGRTFLFRDHEGAVHQGTHRWGQQPDLGKDSRLMTRAIAWAGELPDAPLDEIRILADALLQSDWRNRPHLLLCESVDEDGGAVCRLIGEAVVGGGRRYRGDEDEMPGDVVGNAFLSDERVTVAAGADKGHVGWGELPPLYSPRPDDMFIATNMRTSNAEPPVIVGANLMRIRGGMDAEAVGRWMPSSSRMEGEIFAGGIGLGGREEIQDLVERAEAATHPDEIVIIAVPDAKGEIHCVSQSATGIKLHEVDSLNDDMWNLDLEAGIWIGTGIQWFDCGEDGAQWEADWRRATGEDLKRHELTVEGLAVEWAEYAESDMDAEGVAKMIEEGTVEAA